MEENTQLSTNEQATAVPVTDQKKTAKKKFGLIVAILMLLLVGLGAFYVFSLFAKPGKAIQQVYLIPKDAMFIIQSNYPVTDWKEFSKSKPWQCLKKSPSFAEIAHRAEMLDSIFRENEQFLSLVGKRDLMISAHKVRADLWDFLYIIDLQNMAEIKAFQEQLGYVYTFMNYKVTYRKYQGIDIVELKDQKTREILYTAFVDNHYIASFSSKLVESSINERNEPSIGLDPLFIEADKLVANQGLYRIFLHYKNLPLLLGMYLGKDSEYLPVISESLAYGGFSFHVSDDQLKLKGYNLLNDTVNPYMSALLGSGKKKMNAHTILSERTAFYANIGFDDPATFLNELEKALSQNHVGLYNEYQTSYKKIESMFGISLRGDFLSWMSGEFAFTELEPGLLGQEPEMILAIHTKDIEEARKKMDYIEKKIKRKTPIHIKVVTYKNYEINYVELKGFFALFFGKMFDKFEKPYYTYIDDYVVLSNKPATILSFIEDHEQERLLKNEKEFNKVLDQVESHSTYFAYLNTRKFFPLLKPMLTPQSWADLNSNKEIAYSFPYSGLQVIGGHDKVATQMFMNYQPYTAEPIIEETDTDDVDENITAEEEISELNRFYAEKFQGNLYREFYPEGALKSECEIRDGKRHGKYHEYYENGTLKTRGKYSKGIPKGVWRYYLEVGTLNRKEKI